ncbi:MAG: hypothetical protein QM784_22865 [Polyangiaceae bacterium]
MGEPDLRGLETGRIEVRELENLEPDARVREAHTRGGDAWGACEPTVRLRAERRRNA